MMKKVITPIITNCSLRWVFTFLVLSPTIFSQNVSLPLKPTVPEYRFDEVKYSNGSTVTDVLNMVEDKDGFIWMATRHGLLRYDDHDFLIFNHSLTNENSPVQNYFWCIYLMNDSTLCAGGHGGMSILNLNTYRFTNYSYNDGSCPTEVITDFCTEDADNIWVSGLDGLFLLNVRTGVFTDSKLKVPLHPDVKVPNPNLVKSLLQHPLDKNLLLVGAFNGLISYDKRAKRIHKYYPNNQILANNKYAILEISQMKADGNYLWCVGWYTGLNRFDLKNEKWDNYEFPLFRKTNNALGISKLLLKNEKELWIYHRDDENNLGLGIFNKENKSVQFIKDAQPASVANLPNAYAYIFMQRDSTLWLCYPEGNGLYKQNRKIKRFQLLDIPFKYLWNSAFYYDKSENTYYFGLASQAKGIPCWNANSQKWSLIKPEGDLSKLTLFNIPDFSTNSIIKDSKGVIWVGTALNNLWFIDKKDNVLKMFKLPNGKGLNIVSPIFDIFEDSRKQLWIGTRSEGVFCLNEDRTTAVNYTHNDKDSTSIIDGTSFTTIQEDKYGRIWFGNRKGLCVFDPETKTFSQEVFTQMQKKGIHKGFVYSIEKDTLDRMWMTIVDQGLVRVTENPKGKFNIKVFQTENGLKNLVTRAMTKDKNGCFWIVNYGLLYFNPYTEFFMMTDEGNGLLTNSGGDAKIMVDDYGNVFVDNQVGINWMNEVQKQRQDAVKNLYIEKISVNGNPIEWKRASHDKVTLNHTQNSVTFSYTAICYDEPFQIRYRYKLENIEKDWNPPTSQLFARYMQLKPGKYRFVVDVSYKGRWLNMQRYVDFEIRQVFWKTWWFIAMMVLLVGGMIFGFIRYRLSQYLKMQKLRVKIASDLHDDVGSTLSSISIMSDLLQSQLDNSSRSEQMIRTIGANAHTMLDSMDDIIWSVNPANDKFQNLALRVREYAIPLFEMKNIRFSIDAPEEMNALQMPMDVRRNLYLIAKEAVNNLVKYSHASQADISFGYAYNALTMSVKDNGQGFDLENAKRNRNGLVNMRQRAEQIRGTLTINSEIGKGTCVTLQVKII